MEFNLNPCQNEMLKTWTRRTGDEDVKVGIGIAQLKLTGDSGVAEEARYP